MTPDYSDAWSAIEGLIADIERDASAQMCDRVRQLMGAVLTLHGRGLRQIMQMAQSLEAGSEVQRKLLADPLVRSLLVLHDLHDSSPVERAQEALRSLAEPLRHAGLALDVVIDASHALHVSVRGDAPMPAHLRLSLEHALNEAAPDATAVHIHEVSAGRLPVLREAAP